MREMIEEAEKQLDTLSNKIHQEERVKFDKTIEKLKEEYFIEITTLQHKLNTLQTTDIQYKNTIEKLSDNIYQLNQKIDSIDNENKNMKLEIIQYQTQVAILKSKLVKIKSKFINYQDDYIPRHLSDQHDKSTGEEVFFLKNEIHLLR
jgi:chromosome segregation ATPase